MMPSDSSVESGDDDQTVSFEVREKSLTKKKRKKEIPLNLTKYEMDEVTEFKHVFFSGPPVKRKTNLTLDPEEPKNPFDDADGYYIGRPGDHLEYRYEIIESTGRGNFSEVFTAKDHRMVAKKSRRPAKVAIKILREQEYHNEDQLANEIRILTLLRRGDPTGQWCIVSLFRTFSFRRHFCYVFDALYMDVYTYMKQHNFHGFESTFLRRIAVYILRGLEYLSICGIIHADLKPENIMFVTPHDARVKIVDFGWSWEEDEEALLDTDYFQSRFCRAPEVTMGGPLTTAVDMWSYGCVLAELASGAPMFTGENRHDHLAAVVEVLGIPPRQVFEWKRGKNYFSDTMAPYYCYQLFTTFSAESPGSEPDKAAAATNDLVVLMGSLTEGGDVRGVPGSKHLRHVLGDRVEPEYQNDLENFVLRCLTWLPAERWTPTQASYHKWIAAEYQRVESTPKSALKAFRPRAVDTIKDRLRQYRARVQRIRNEAATHHQHSKVDQLASKRRLDINSTREVIPTEKQVMKMLISRFNSHAAQSHEELYRPKSQPSGSGTSIGSRPSPSSSAKLPEVHPSRHRTSHTSVLAASVTESLAKLGVAASSVKLRISDSLSRLYGTTGNEEGLPPSDPKIGRKASGPEVLAPADSPKTGFQTRNSPVCSTNKPEPSLHKTLIYQSPKPPTIPLTGKSPEEQLATSSKATSNKRVLSPFYTGKAKKVVLIPSPDHYYEPKENQDAEAEKDAETCTPVAAAVQPLQIKNSPTAAQPRQAAITNLDKAGTKVVAKDTKFLIGKDVQASPKATHCTKSAIRKAKSLAVTTTTLQVSSQPAKEQQLRRYSPDAANYLLLPVMPAKEPKMAAETPTLKPLARSKGLETKTGTTTPAKKVDPVENPRVVTRPAVTKQQKDAKTVNVVRVIKMTPPSTPESGSSAATSKLPQPQMIKERSESLKIPFTVTKAVETKKAVKMNAITRKPSKNTK